MSYSSSVLQHWVLPSLLWRFHLADREPGQEPRLRRCQRNETLAFLTTILQELYLTVSQNIKNFRNICLSSTQSSSLSVKTTVSNLKQQKTRSSVPSKHTFKARPSATGASPPWRHISLYICIYMAGSKGKSQARNFLGTLSMLSPS